MAQGCDEYSKLVEDFVDASTDLAGNHIRIATDTQNDGVESSLSPAHTHPNDSETHLNCIPPLRSRLPPDFAEVSDHTRCLTLSKIIAKSHHQFP